MASAKPPAAAMAKASAEAATLRRQIRGDVAEALGGPPQPRAKRTASSTKDSAPTRAAAGSTRSAASSTKVAFAPAKATTARKQAAPALKAPAPLPAPRQAPPKVVIRFPKLPGQAHAARYEGPSELQAQLTQFRRFLATAKMVSEARKLTADERHLIECARARIKEIQSLGLVGVR